MTPYGFAAELELDEDYSDESYEESDDMEEYDDFAEARRRRFPGRRVGKVNPGKVAKAGGVVRPPAPTGKVVTRAEFNAALAKIDKKIDTNGEALKKVTSQTNKITADLGAATSRLDKQVGDLRKDVKKQAETNLLLTLLNKAPAIKATTATLSVPTAGGGTRDVDVVTKVEQEKTSNLLPLVLLSGSGGFGGGDSSNMLILALALSGQI